MPDDPGSGDRLAAAVAELYGAAPEDFTGRRGELAAAARSAGDRAGAKAIGALRRPTRAAWVVNVLARTDPGAPAELAELGAALGAAQQAGQAARLRELSAARWALVEDLATRALAAAGVAEVPPSLRLEITETLTAALADPAVAAEFAAGTLTKAMQWSGFGVAPDSGTGASAWAASAEPARRLRAVPAPRDAAPSPGADETSAPPDARPATGSAGRRRGLAPRREAAGSATAEHTGTAPPVKTTDRRAETTAERREAETRRQAERARQQAAAARQLAAEQAARRREQQAEAEREVAAAETAAAEAVAAEDRLEADVRDLEQQLTTARDELAAARMRARRAEAAERRARQVLDRLPR